MLKLICSAWLWWQKWLSWNPPLEELEYGEAIGQLEQLRIELHTWHYSATIRFAYSRKQQESEDAIFGRAAPKFVACFIVFLWFRGAKSAERGIQEKNNSIPYVYIFDMYNMIQWIYVRTVICKFLCLASCQWRSVQSQGFKEEWCLSLKWRQLKRQLKTRNKIPATTELGEAYRKMM